MAIRAVGVGLLIFSVPIMGCGTIKNTVLTPSNQGGTTPFGGVHEDLAGINTAEEHSDVGRKLLCAADLPLSAVTDVVILPYTCAYTYINRPNPMPSVLQPQPLPLPPMPPPGSYPPASNTQMNLSELNNTQNISDLPSLPAPELSAPPPSLPKYDPTPLGLPKSDVPSPPPTLPKSDTLQLPPELPKSDPLSPPPPLPK